MNMKENDYIEKIILENFEKLSDSEPPEGHSERFQAKLKKNKGRSLKIDYSLIWKIAAAVVFIFLAVNQVIIRVTPRSENQISSVAPERISLSSVSAEYEEVEFYYANAIDVELEQWNNLVSQGYISEEEQNMMKNELEDFENVFNKLQADLQASPNDERVINAMLDYYQTKLNLISMIVNKLQEVKQLNNTDYEPEI